MDIRKYANHAICQEFLTRVISTLRTISNNFTASAIENFAKETVARYVSVEWLDNNDLGIIVDRIVNRSQLITVSDVTEDVLYGQLRLNDHVITSAIESLAYRIATTISPALHTLRDSIHAECETLVNDINSKVQDPTLTTYQTETFSWGDLNNAAFEQSAKMVARAVVSNDLNLDAPTAYDVDKIATIMPLEQISPMNTSVVEALITALGNNNPDTVRFARCLTSVSAYNMWVSELVSVLKKDVSNFAEHLVENVTRMVTFTNLADKFSALSEPVVSENTMTTLRQNLEILKTEMRLGYAGLIYHRINYGDSIILTNRHLNSDAQTKLEEAGATISDAVAYMRYNNEIHNNGIPNYGVSIANIIANKEYINNAISEFDQKMNDTASAQAKASLQRSLEKVLDNYHSAATVPTGVTSMTYDNLHINAVHRALAKAGLEEVALESVVTDYLIDMTPNGLVRSIYQNVDKRFSELVTKTDTTTEIDVNTQLCYSIMDVVMSFLLVNHAVTQNDIARAA